MAKTPETTPNAEWIVPNQALIEEVVDARIEKHFESEKGEKKAASPRARTASTPSKEDDKP